jgi:hypothetical protein
MILSDRRQLPPPANEIADLAQNERGLNCLA